MPAYCPICTARAARNSDAHILACMLYFGSQNQRVLAKPYKNIKGYVQLILSEFKDTEHCLETAQKEPRAALQLSQRVRQNDMNWIKLILSVFLVAIIASQFFMYKRLFETSSGY